MDHAITVGEVLGFLGIALAALAVLGILVGVLWFVLWFMGQGWNH